MAICAFCGKRVGFLEGEKYTINGRLYDFCGDCYKLHLEAREGDTDAMLELHKYIMNSSLDAENKIAFMNHFGLPMREEDIKKKARERKLDGESQQLRREKIQNAVISFLATTANELSGYEITEYLGILSSETVLGTGFFSELSAGVNDFFGSTSNTMTSKVTEAKENALRGLYQRCAEADADAVIGVDFDMMTIGANMIVVSANGTAVKVKKKD